MNKTLNLGEVAEYLGIRKRTLYEMIKDRRFPVEPIKGINPKVWELTEIDKWRNAQ